MSTSGKPMRMVCQACGGWMQTTSGEMISMSIDGNEPGSADEAATLKSRAALGPFIDRHLKHLRRGQQISCVYENEPAWEQVDPKKQER